MPIQHRVEADTGLLVVERTGTVTDDEESESVRARAADPHVTPGIRVLVDCTGLERADSASHVRRAAERAVANARNLRCGPVAIVVTTQAAYGMARMYQTLTEESHPSTRIFGDVDEARGWLRATEGGGS